jgi:predicted porin
VSNANAPSATGVSGVRGHRGVALLGGAFLIGSVLATGVVQAQASGAPAAAPADTSLTMHGITLYGIVDIGLQYVTNGAPISDYFPAGGTGLLQKNSRETVTGLNPSNLSQSRIGLRGAEPLIGDWNAVFRLETFFNPQSGNVSDALKSLVLNNGKPATAQATGVDSSIAGQVFGGAAYAGVSSKAYGTLTFGRQNGLQADGVGKYDPQAASNSFSVIGYSGAAAGAGNTEDRRLDNSAKYEATLGPVHLGGQYQFNGGNGAGGRNGNATELNLGFVFPGGSVDAYYVKKYQAVGATSLSSAQVASLPTKGGYSISNSLNATISDNTMYSLMGLYNVGPVRLYAGYEHINFSNPSESLQPGANTIGGYTLAFTNNAAFPNDKVLKIYWAGVKFKVNPIFEVTGAYYGYKQDAYGAGALAGCSTVVSGTCSGTLSAASLVGVWKMSKRFDVYAGAMWNSVKDGLANGYLKTSTIDPTIGVRYTF